MCKKGQQKAGVVVLTRSEKKSRGKRPQNKARVEDACAGTEIMTDTKNSSVLKWNHYQWMSEILFIQDQLHEMKLGMHVYKVFATRQWRHACLVSLNSASAIFKTTSKYFLRLFSFEWPSYANTRATCWSRLTSEMYQLSTGLAQICSEIGSLG